MDPISSLAPPEPTSLAETGLGTVMLRNIFLKTMFRQGLNSIAGLSRALCLPDPVTEEIARDLRRMLLVEPTPPLPSTDGEPGLELTEAGKRRAHDALGQSEYFGPMPVPLAGYAAQVKRQSVRRLGLPRARLEAAFSGLLLPARLIDQLGPAIGTGRSILMYGPPGNGKSSIARAIRDALDDIVHVPHAVEYQGHVITLYDPAVHGAVPLPEEPPSLLRRTGSPPDRRYVACRRPAVITGGELSLRMLDLTYSETSRSYQAPLQMKSSGGVFIVDDLGRQSDTPQSIIDRWIIPLEAGHDILTLHTGEKFHVPFDTLVIFSTNFHPHRIFDQAALRRIFFKIRIEGPSQEAFLGLFAQVARQRRMPLDEAALIHLIKNKYPLVDNVYAAFHASFLIDQMVAICQFEGIAPQMSPDLIDRAWSNLFIEESDVAH